MIVIYNPIAGRRKIQNLWSVLDILATNGVRFELLRTQAPGHAAKLAHDAARHGARTIVAAGGDGTIADVVKGLLAHPAPTAHTRLGIIPLGTANVLAHELGLRTDPPSVAACLAFGRSQPLWPGLAESPQGDRLFVQMLGAGFDAQVVHHLSAPLKRAIGKGAYVAQTLCELAAYKFPPLAINLDGEDVSAASVIVSKGRLYGGPHLLAPRACPREPGFSVALFHHRGQWPTLVYGAALPLNLLPKAPGVELRRARRITISAAIATPVQADGDEAGFLPLTIHDAPRPIEVLCQ